MGIEYQLTDDYPQDIEFEPFGAEQPPTKFRHSYEELYQWAKGLGSNPNDFTSRNNPDVHQLRETSWQIGQIRHRLRNEGGVNQEAENEFIRVMELAAALEQACKDYLQNKGSTS